MVEIPVWIIRLFVVALFSGLVATAEENENKGKETLLPGLIAFGIMIYIVFWMP